MKNRLIQIKTGMWINPDDLQFEEKMLRFGKLEPASQLHKAKMLRNSGYVQDAKELYKKLLNHKESYYIHQQLAPLCGAAEALGLARKYQSDTLKSLYYKRVLEQDATNREAKVFFQNPSKKWALWLALFLICTGIAVLCALLVKNLVIHQSTTTTTISKKTYNHVFYIDQLPDSLTYSRKIDIPSGLNGDAIADVIDQSTLTAGVYYKIEDSLHHQIGYVISREDGLYDIYLLSGGFVKPATNAETGLVSAQTINFVRTAFEYYMQTHNQNPPQTLAALSAYVPDAVPLSKLDYHPGAKNPEEAILDPGGRPVPFEKPYVVVNIQTKKMNIKYGGETLLSADVGVGRSDQPTPIGSFVITDRIKNGLSPVYGPYIFPLNDSHFAIHGTNDDSKVGKMQSIGCVELHNDTDQKLYQMLPVGTPVIITDQPDETLPKLTWFRGK